MECKCYQLNIGCNKMISIVLIPLLLLWINRAHGAELTYNINEEQQKDTYIGNVAEDYNLRSTMTSEEYNNLVYKILASGNTYASYFRVINTTGQLYTTSPIDRDAISHCLFSTSCTVPLDVAVQATIGAFFRKINIEINVKDLNDNSPVFPKSVDSVQFSENSMVNTSTTIAGAQDRDAGNNTVVRYYIETADVPFDVTLEKKVDGTSEVKLVVTGNLDREKQDFYQIKVVAEDGGDPKRTGTVNVNISILDVNDNTPKFDRAFYNITLNEDIAANTVVETLSAFDSDIDKNGEIEYKLSANQNVDISKLFAINSSTGELSVIGQLIYIPTEQMLLYAEAADKGTQPRISQVVIYVNIFDSKNKPPLINVNILSGDVDARVSEYANVGAVVAHIAVIDDDTGRNGKVECIGLSDNFGLERYESNEYKAVVLKSLNRELKDTHEVVIVCRDNGSPPLNATANFTVKVLDENDNPPRFTQGTYFSKTKENNEVGDIVAHVLADDADIGANAKIEYSILSSGGYSFWMDSVSGEIRANFVIDRENVSQITIRVIAFDGGNPRLTATSTVILTITDENDNYPVFSLPNYEFMALEGTPFNTTVDQLTVTDKDYDENAKVVFSFANEPSSSFPFVLYSDGTIKLIKVLDREIQSKYEFRVIASDQGSPPLSSSVTVTVIVLDINDNAPVFVFPNEDNNTASIPLSSAAESVTILVTATDKDEKGFNSDLSYSILDSNVTSLFIMESRNGVGTIRLLRKPGSDEPLRYTLRIQAQDGGKPRRSSIQVLNIAFMKDQPEDDGRQNFLIAVTLGCVTVVLSIGIVLTICLIRRHDKLRNKDCTSCTDMADLQIVPADSKQRVELGSTSSGSKESLKKVSFSTDYNSTLESLDHSKDMPQAPLVIQDEYKTDHGRLPISSSSPRSYSSNLYDPDMQKLDPATVLQIHRSLLQSHDQLWTNHRDGHTII